MYLFFECLLYLVCILVALLIFLYFAATWNHAMGKDRGMAYPRPRQFLGSALQLMRGTRPHGELAKELYNSFAGNRAVGGFYFGQNVIGIRDPEAIRMLAVEEFDSFTDHMQFFEEKYDKLLGKALYSMRGDRWRGMRATLSPAFTASKMKAMYTLIDKCGEQLACFLHDKCKDNMLYEVEAKDFFTRYTSDVIATSAYGLQCDSQREPGNEFYKMGREISSMGGFRVMAFAGYFFIPRVMMWLSVKLTPPYLENFFTSIIKNAIETREKDKIIRPDMIHLLMEAKKGTLENDGEDTSSCQEHVELTDDDIAAQTYLFFVAGSDNVSTTLTFLAYKLAVCPEIQERLQQEIDEVLVAEVLSYDAVQKMKYLDAVISETLRMWTPTVDLDRKCLKDFTVPATETDPAIIIKKGDDVQFSVYGIHNDPEHWTEPERFDPDRFSDENKHKIKPFTFMPFGVGPRACIGSRFAMMMIKVAMANVLSKVTLVRTDKTPVPIQLKKGYFNNQPQDGVWLGVKPRT